MNSARCLTQTTALRAGYSTYRARISQRLKKSEKLEKPAAKPKKPVPPPYVPPEREAVPHVGRVPRHELDKGRSKWDIVNAQPVQVSSQAQNTPREKIQHTPLEIKRPAASAKRPFEVREPEAPIPLFKPPPPPAAAAPPLNTDPETKTAFTSPPLMHGLVKCVRETIGIDALPTHIQREALDHMLDPSARDLWSSQPTSVEENLRIMSSLNLSHPRQKSFQSFLLASETGSGKSMAYLLPVLQSVKEKELALNLDSNAKKSISAAPIMKNGKRSRLHNPTALILAPTHELTRQLAGFAKALLHEVKLKVVCASQSSISGGGIEGTHGRMNATASKAKQEALAYFDTLGLSSPSGSSFETQNERPSHPSDVLVGTPMKVLELVRGRGWDRLNSPPKKQPVIPGIAEDEHEPTEEEETIKRRRGTDLQEGQFGRAGKQEVEANLVVGLSNIQWVVVDEADVLFDPDFLETTRLLLSDIAAARQHLIPAADSELENPMAENYPFNLVLTSATIPNSLSAYLHDHHPSMRRLSSPNLHHLPKGLQTEYVNWSGSNKYADIERRMKKIWAEESIASGAPGSSPLSTQQLIDGTAKKNKKAEDKILSKVLIFCNKSTKVNDLAEYLDEKGIKNVALTSTGTVRRRGTNRHLDGFMKTKEGEQQKNRKDTEEEQPRVMITTSLLSRGLDFAPSVKHIFIVDEPRNLIDFLHRAGRTGRAGEHGRVVIFGKTKGRGSDRSKEVRKRVGGLVAH